MAVILEAERETLKLRLLAIAAIAFGLYTRRQDLGDTLLLFAGLILVYLVYALSLKRFIIPVIRTRYLVYGMIVIDAAVLVLFMDMAGGLESNLFVLFPVFIIFYAIYLDYFSSFFAAIVLSFALVGYAVFTEPIGVSRGTMVAFQVPLFFLLAYFSGFLAKRATQEKEKRETLQELIRIESGTRGLREIVNVINRAIDLYEDWSAGYLNQTPEKEAIEKLQFSLSIDSQYALAHYAFGRVYAETGQLNRAVEVYTRATTLDPNLIEAQRGLSEVLVRQGRFEAALDPAERFAEASQQEWEAYQNLAVIYSELGREEESRSAGERALTLSSGDDREALRIFFSRMWGEAAQR
ncbi:MAG: tetratricopeptide repeat protein [Dehalococcoidia bacterium]|nr:tetratricopeptide repeat protein [Dehalococcoidia bacterium]